MNTRLGDDGYTSTEYWLDSNGLIKQTRWIVYHPSSSGSPESRFENFRTFSEWGVTNVITPPVGVTLPTPVPPPTPTPTLVPTPTPTNTPEPTQTPVPAQAWLEPDPETITFDGGQWRQFTLRGTGLERVDLAINVINYPDGPSSTGAVELESRSSLPSATDACRTTYYTGYSVSVGYTFSLVGCRPGVVIIRLADPGNNYALIREYTVAVSGGP